MSSRRLPSQPIPAASRGSSSRVASTIAIYLFSSAGRQVEYAMGVEPRGPLRRDRERRCRVLDDRRARDLVSGGDVLEPDDRGLGVAVAPADAARRGDGWLP